MYLPVPADTDQSAEKFNKPWEHAYSHFEGERVWWETGTHTAGKGALPGEAMTYLPLLLWCILLCLYLLGFPRCPSPRLLMTGRLLGGASMWADAT